MKQFKIQTYISGAVEGGAECQSAGNTQGDPAAGH